MKLSISPLGDSAIRIERADRDDAGVLELCAALESSKLPGFREGVPAYTTVVLHYDPLAADYQALVKAVESASKKISASDAPLPRKVVEIPVCYGGEFGPDLEFVANYHGLAQDDVAPLHSEPDYPVRFIGFLPGFPYLSGLSESLSTPRLETPRLNTPAGSVGIAGNQTGIYPMNSPGGWRIIGRTPTRLYLPEQDPPSLLCAGDSVRFVPISTEEFQRREQEVSG